MKDRFTHISRFGRHSISAKDRAEVYERDDFTCQYCLNQYGTDKLSIDHLIPVSLGGLHEIRNYVTCCRSCNSSKKDKPLTEFAKKINIKVKALPIHGDPVLDNEEIPLEIRLIRQRIFHGIRLGKINFTGKSVQKKIEKKFRRDVWNSSEGKQLIDNFPNLPGHVRIMLPEIESIASSQEDFILLIELAKSASTRNLIGNEISAGANVMEIITHVAKKSKNEALQKRIQQTISRAQSIIDKLSISPDDASNAME